MHLPDGLYQFQYALFLSQPPAVDDDEIIGGETYAGAVDGLGGGEAVGVDGVMQGFAPVKSRRYLLNPAGDVVGNADNAAVGGENEVGLLRVRVQEVVVEVQDVR